MTEKIPCRARRTRMRFGGFDKRELAAIFAGGTVGAVLRVWIVRRLVSDPTQWPWAVFIVNVTGSAALAYFATRLQERLPQSLYRRPLLGTGFCGAYTTFSTMQLEIVEMLDHHADGLAFAYACASITGGLVAVWLTTALVRRTRMLA
jgi:fluoride exporter